MNNFSLELWLLIFLELWLWSLLWNGADGVGIVNVCSQGHQLTKVLRMCWWRWLWCSHTLSTLWTCPKAFKFHIELPGWERVFEGWGIEKGVSRWGWCFVFVFVCVCVCETLLWDGSGCVCSFLTFNKLLLGIVAAANVIIQFGGSLIHLALLWNKSFISFICFFCCLNYSLYKGNSTTFIGLALLSHNFKGDHYC